MTNSCLATLNTVYFTLAGIFGNAAAGYIFDVGGSMALYYSCALVLALNVLFLQSFKQETNEDLGWAPMSNY